MARQRSQSEEPSPNPHLLVPRGDFEIELAKRIEAGESLVSRSLSTKDDLEKARADFYTWDEYNTELLKRRFTNPDLADKYEQWLGGVFPVSPTFQHEVHEFHDDVTNKLRRLESIQERLPLFEVAATVGAQVPGGRTANAASQSSAATSIFLVHGHDEAAKLSVQGFIRDVTDLDPLVLADQANRGQTVIEKFETHGAAAAFAVVILSGDDAARIAANEKAPLVPRGRQNVVFEFGYFVSALGRSRVAVLYEAGVELPSDVAGLVYIPYDRDGAWKLKLAKELKAAGIAVDANKLL